MSHGKFSGKCHNCGKHGIRLQSVGVVVKHHALTDACHTNRQYQDKINSNKRSRKVSFNPCIILSVICKVLWLGIFKLVKF